MMQSLVTTLLGGIAIFVSIIQAAEPVDSLFPALARCQAARAAYPTGSHYADHFQALAQETTDGFAEFCLSFMPNDPHQAIGWLEQAAQKGLPEAQLLLATAYELGHRVEVDPRQAWYWYQAAAHKNFGPAQYEVAAILYGGTRLGQSQDFAKALFWAELAAYNRVPQATELRDILLKLVAPDEAAAIRHAVRSWLNQHHLSSRRSS